MGSWDFRVSSNPIQFQFVIELFRCKCSFIELNFIVYKVVRVVDGDTLSATDGKEEVKIRLIGVDTPETVHPIKPVEAYPCGLRQGGRQQKTLGPTKCLHGPAKGFRPVDGQKCSS